MTAATSTAPTSPARCCRSGSSRPRYGSSETTPRSSPPGCAPGSRATCSSSRAGSGRPTTTARSSCSPPRPDDRCVHDPELHARIESISRGFASRSGRFRRTRDFGPGVQQAGDDPRGRAAGRRHRRHRPRPSARARRVHRRRPARAARASCRRCGAQALGLAPLARARRARPCTALAPRVLRFYGVGEVRRRPGARRRRGEPDGVDVTICARDSEIHVDLLVAPGAEQAAADAFDRRLPRPDQAVPLTRESAKRSDRGDRPRTLHRSAD